MLRSLLLYAIIIAAVPIALFRPFEGVLIYLWLSFGRGGDFVWAPYTFYYFTIVALACLGGFALFEMPRSPIRLKGMIPLLLFWMWLGVTFVKGFDSSLAFSKLLGYSPGFF